MSEATRSTPRQAETRQPRHLARIGAVQALYQMDLSGTDAGEVIQQFVECRFAATEAGQDADPSDDDLIGGDAKFFSDIVEGVVRRQRDIDPLIDRQLADGWRLKRVDSILRAILRAGVYELIDRSDIPVRVVINEYINVGHAFFSDDEPRVINGVLHALSGEVRAREVASHDASRSK
ncbi:MAG: transcription antitermination factor NusB [Alphaproteobacteria bacterium]|nr:transcription antitermination factor NusB [Alphaproteobacteria bacterium]